MPHMSFKELMNLAGDWEWVKLCMILGNYIVSLTVFLRFVNWACFMKKLPKN